MGLAHSPKIVTDGLSFIYDTGSGKSYKGEPTTNLNTFTLSDSGTDGSGQSSVGTRTVISDNYVRIVDAASNTRQTHVITGLTASTTYTVSIMYKKLIGAPTFRFQIQDYSGSSYLRTIKFTNTSEIGIEDKEGWQLASWTFTLGSDANAVRIWYQDGADYTTYTHSFELQNPQLEAKSHATPYVDGTRSTTQGLLDLTKNETITLSNMSYDSNAQMSFDGTDDQFVITDPGVGTSFSIEVVIKVDNYSNGPIFISPNSVGIDHFFRVNSNGTIRANFVEIADSSSDGYTSTTTINTGEYYHVVISKTPSNGTIYVNGVAEDSHTPTLAAAAWSGDWRIGARWNNTYNLNGELPILKVYDRDLAPAEVLQNYNAFKSRFL